MSKLCFGCMKLKENSPVCEHCGFDERTENLSHQLPVGTMLANQYLIGRVLGQGGFGITYMAWDQHLSIPVAIKEYYPAGVVHRHTQLGPSVLCDNGQSPEMFAKHRERFLQEARTLAQLSDIPEIVKVRNFFPENGTAYIVMEYVHGITLKQYLKNLGRPMTESETRDIVKPVLEALSKVHKQNMIHRDISPDNIMLPASGGVKLIDFGTVRYVDGSGVSKSTETVLKPGFAPMEQYNARGNLGTWTDVYALCASFHYLMTGKVPPDVHERMEAGEALSILRNTPGISKTTVEILERGMKLRHVERIQTMEELHDLLYGNEKLKPLPVQKEAKKSAGRKKAKAWIPFAAIAAAAAVVGALALTKAPAAVPDTKPGIQLPLLPVSEEETQYQNALSLMSYGRHDKALEIFEALGEYKDSLDNANLCRNVLDYAQAESFAEQKQYGKAAIAFAKLEGYEDARERSFAMWKKVRGRRTISLTAADSHMAIHAIRDDGTVAVDFRESDVLTDEALNAYPIAHFRDVVSIQNYFALRYDGTVAVPDTEIMKSSPFWKDFEHLAAIASHRENVSGWTDLVALASDNDFNVIAGVRSDGSVLISGGNGYSQADVSSWNDVVAISVADTYIVGLRADGTVVAAGDNRNGQCDVQNWTNVIDIATGSGATLGLSSGDIVATGSNMWGATTLARKWNNVVELEDGPFAILGTAEVSPGFYDGPYQSCDVDDWTNIVAVVNNGTYTVGLCSDGTLAFSQMDSFHDYSRASSWTDIQCP